jgi:hypothetical protein
MSGLSSTSMLRTWEAISGRGTVEQALILLAAGYPELDRERLATLSIGQRDALLLSLHERTFGARLEAYAECPCCRERLEFGIDTADIRVTGVPIESDAEYRLVYGDLDLTYRLPTSADLLTLVDCRDTDHVQDRLLECCVLQATRAGNPVKPVDLPGSVIAELAKAIVERDPQAEVLLDLHCPSCDHRWQTLLEIAEFVSRKVTIEAKRLLCEVDALARAYGWREADILALSPTRRQAYLELVEI